MIARTSRCARYCNWGALALVAGALFACSDSSEADSLNGWELAPAETEQNLASPVTAQEHEDWLGTKFAERLSDEELELLEDALRESGEDVTGITFVGRMALLGDVYLDLDATLQRLRRERDGVDKGRTLDDTDSRTGPGNFPTAPTIYSSNFNGSYRFHRPDVLNMRIVVPNGSANDFLVPALQAAANAVVGAADDCLQSIPVIRQSDYDALSLQEQNGIKAIFVRRGPRTTVCPASTDDTLACALFPRDEFRDFDFNVSSTRLVPGRHMGLVDTQITSQDPKVWVLTHELLHTLGLAHPNDTLGPHAVVSGTSCSRSVQSIMTRLGRPTDVISADDRLTIDILYSPPPGTTSCAYRRESRIIGPTVNPCP